MSPTTILLYGRTGSGKTTQIGVLAEHVMATSGKKTRLYTVDSGGLDTIRPHINLGIIEVAEIGTSNPWLFANKSTSGFIKGPDSKWKLDKEANANIGLYAFESAQALARLLQENMDTSAGNGMVMGGDTNTTFKVAGDGETLTIGASKGYGRFYLPQGEVFAAMRRSFNLSAEYVLWTAGISKDDDDINTSKIIGPDVLGKALTGVLPGAFNYTMRQDVVPTKDPKLAPRHLLYLGTHQDLATGNATALGNIRRPLDAPKLDSYVVEPADIVKALSLVRFEAQKAAEDAIRKRMGAKLVGAK